MSSASRIRDNHHRAAFALQSGRNAALPRADEIPTSAGDAFDLVTWLVILSPEVSDA